VADPIEVNARGATFIAAEALGYMKFEDAARYTAIAREYTPLPEHRALYDKTFKEFVQYYHQTKDLYREMNP
jgi:xylulokinase